MTVNGDVHWPLERRWEIDRVQPAGDRGQLVLLEVEGGFRVDVRHIEIGITGAI